MASYTRQSTFSDGDLITAALFNDEYNQLLAAFDNATGHKHDGTVGEGPVISVLGDAGLATPLNKILIDTTNDHIEFWIDVSGTSTQQLYIADGAIVPVTDNDIDLGTNSLQFKDLYINGTANIDTLAADSVDINGGNIDGTVIGATTAAAGTFTTIDASGNVVISGNLTVSGTTTSVNSNEVNIGDNILVLNSDETGTPSQNAGIEIERGTSTNVSLLWNESNDYWTFGSNDLNFPDSSKAKFGTGNDLEIYHDGNHSYIADVGTGNLRLLGNDLRLQTASGAENYLKGDLNGAVTLYYDNSAKLATTSTGIDVTGTVTSDGLTVNSGTTDTVATFQSSDQFADLALTDSGGTSYIRQSNGSLILEADRANAVSGSALVFQIDGSNIARFTSDGRLGIGETTPSDLLHINKNQDAGTQIQIENQNTGTSSYAGLNLNGQGNNFTIKNWGDGTSKANATEFISTASGSHFIFSTQSTERARIDANGNLLIGTTAADIVGSSSATGINLNPNSASSFNRSGGAPLFVNRIGSDGTLLQFRKSGSTVGEIGTNSGYIRIGTGDTHLLYHSGIDTIIPYSGSANRDNAISLGYSGARFKDLHLAGTVNFGSLSDGTTTITGFVDEDNMSSNSATLLPTQQSVKAYVDSQISSAGGNGISFEDNEKAQFGDGNDLQIYHDGGNSYIRDLGTGNLRIDATDFYVRSSSGTQLKIGAVDNGAVNLYYAGSKKLATTSSGIDVTGNIEVGDSHLIGDDNFDNLALVSSSGENIIVGASNDIYFTTGATSLSSTGTTKLIVKDSGNIGIGTTSPNNKLTVSGASDGINIVGTNSFVRWNSGNMMIRDEGSYAMGFHTYDGSTGQVERMRITSAGNIGVGTSSPAAPLHVVGNTYVQSGTFYTNEITSFSGSSLTLNGGSSHLNILVNGSERARIDSSGNLGIGTTSPAAKLDVRAANGNEISLNIGRSDTGSYFKVNHAGNDLRIYNTGGTGQDILFGVDAAGTYQNNKVGIGTASPNATLEVATSATTNIDVAHFSNSNGAVKAKFHLAASTGDGQLTLYDGNNNADVLISSVGNSYLNSGGRLGLNTTNPTTDLEVNASGANGIKITSDQPYLFFNDTDNSGTTYDATISFSGDSLYIGGASAASIVRFRNKASFGESARLDSSGNLLVGKTGTTFGNAGIEAEQMETFRAIRDGANVADFNRLTSDGNIVAFYKDGTAKAVIGSIYTGFGTGSPATPLHVYHSTINTIATFQSGDTGAGINLVDNGGTSTIQQTTDILRIGVDEDGAVANSVIAFRVDGSEKARF